MFGMRESAANRCGSQHDDFGEADLIVLGLSGLDGADATRPGTTVLQVVRQAPCPALVGRAYLTKRAPMETARDHRSSTRVPVAA